MPDRLPNQTTAEFESAEPDAGNAGNRRDAFDIDRWADLLATNRVSWPADICPDAADRLSMAVRERRRSRLVSLMSRLIAADLIRGKSQNGRTYVSETD